MAVSVLERWEDPDPGRARARGTAPAPSQIPAVRGRTSPQGPRITPNPLPRRWDPENPVSPTNGGNSGVATDPTAPSAHMGSPWDEYAFRQGWLGSGGRTVDDLQRYIEAGGYGQHVSRVGSKGDKIRLPNGQIVDAVLAAGEGGRGAQWLTDDGGGFDQVRAGGAGNVFDDPATTEWETLLRQLVERLNQPQPTMSDSQRDLLQTQSLDPLERQRQAQRQQTTERLAARGITGGSGVLEQALQDVDKQFNQLRTGTQAGFAIDQVNREDQRFQGNEQRATNALNLFQRIPELADRRLGMAQNSLQQTNPYQLLQLQQQGNQYAQGQQNYNQQQQQAFWNDLARLFAGLF